MPASKATDANVFYNGNFAWTPILRVQSVDDDFTNESIFTKGKDPLFKAENTGVQGTELSSRTKCGFGNISLIQNCLQKAYEMQSSNDWTDLGEFLDTVNNAFSNVEEAS